MPGLVASLRVIPAALAAIMAATIAICSATAFTLNRLTHPAPTTPHPSDEAEGSIIAAGALIPEQMIIPPNSLVAGVPGKIRRTLGDEDRKMILKYAQNYLDYTTIYLNEK